ncbi:tyrosine--tRNA ligase [Conexibacter sp. JD483]|uniref:tyrosine--tRNA ligase n=1 Tax=unclassified Conexibacter TaxID=2627773 RepID=UPI00271F5779|nr:MULTISPECIES: tyrosine--tRNA ligase [unclassified Conexibacter]MDO8185789.1 tyrosine--tRNA ligase [Conexibacter sp. CPCC 205706]MDO8199166.1 tyrosine--tRNA ligase [Conexibacter sp. CPCC 205762]MDR9369889.1 tyrosine--tRNA ligase [Conexibacter sp. JD483]
MSLETSTPAATAAWLARNAVDCLPAGGLQRKLEEAAREGRPLRIKLGIDPTAPDIHLGFTVVLGKLREFQDLGHTVVLIIGDYTARVGDPSGRSATRPVLSGEQIDANAQTFQAQAMKVLDPDRLEVRRNGEWLDMRTEELFSLARTTTVARILERDDFAKRYAAHAPISILELFYPLLQGYDSVVVEADVELGGTDQKFNLLLGRDIQHHYGKPEQVILTMPILPGVDGERKMSKSFGNYIGVTEPPEEIYGKTLRLPDEALGTWYELLVGAPPPADVGPRDAKRALARTLVARFHDDESARAAEAAFDRLHLEHRPPDEMPDAPLDGGADGQVHLPALLASTFGVTSSEGRRLLRQGGVKLDGEPLAAEPLDRPASELDGRVLQLGKRRFARLRSN